MKKISPITLCFLIILFSTLLLTNSVNAQDQVKYGIYELIDKSNHVDQNSSKLQGRKTSKVDSRARFYDLAFKKHPTHYFDKNGFKSKSGSSKPLKINLGDPKSFNNILESNYEKDNVELIIISLDNQTELHNSLDLSNNNDFKKLKYVFIRCNYNCSNEDIMKFVKVKSNISVFYKYDLPR